MMRPVLNREEYMALRNGGEQRGIVAAVRAGAEQQKSRLVQMNYSCLPNDDGSLKGSRKMSTTVGMDIDHVNSTDMQPLRERILAKKQELGLLMLEESVRGQGYHLVFRRHQELSQEENLRWVSDLLGVEYDKGAKDITRVFFTTTEKELVYLDDAIFDNSATDSTDETHKANTNSTDGTDKNNPSDLGDPCSEKDYNGLPYADIIRKWWELYNEGKEPVKSNRDVLTFELAVNLRHICGFDRELMGRVIPCYDGFPVEQKMKCIDSALAERRTMMPKRLKDVLQSLTPCSPDLSPGEGSENSRLDEVMQEDERFYYSRLPKMPQGVKDSIDAVGPQLAMPAIVAVAPVIGMLATGVRLDVHGVKNW